MQGRLQVGGHDHQIGIARSRPHHHPADPHHNGFQRVTGFGLRNDRPGLLFHEARRLFHTHPQPQGDGPQRQSDKERNAPAPVMQSFWCQQRRQQRHNARTGQQSQRNGKRLQCAVQPPFAARGELGHQRYRAAILAAREQPLQDPQDGDNQRGGNADAGIHRYETDGRGGQRHHHQHDDKRGLTPDTIADPPEDDGAQRTKEKGDSKRGVGEDQAGQPGLAAELEKVFCNHSGQKTVHRKFVPFDEITN